MRPRSMPISNGPSDKRSDSRALRMTRSTSPPPRFSFGLDVGGLDQRPPLVDLGLVVRGECLCGLLLARRNLLAESGEPLADGGIGERVHGRRSELLDDLARRSLGNPQ